MCSNITTNDKKICRYCNRIFYKHPNVSIKKWEIRTFCCLKCRTNWRLENEWIVSICKICGKDFRHYKYLNRQFCSQLCSNRSRPKRGGNTGLLKKMRGWKIFQEWRASVLERDNFTCKWCDKWCKKTEIHHIIPIKDDLTKIFDINNGITLCYECHRKTKGKEEKYKELFFELIK